MIHTQNQLVQECFDGTSNRHCESCAANYKVGGICCFGHRYEDQDDSCRTCQYKAPCRYETVSFLNRNKVHSPPIQPTYQDHRFTKPENRPIIQVSSSQNRSVETDTKVFARQLGKHAVWGAVEGALEMVLNFFRSRRPF